MLLAAGATGLIVPVSALADTTTAPPTITSAFTPSLIVVGQDATSALSITITNPNASTALSGIAFTDTLPSGLTVDNPNGESGSCGSTVGVSATPGTSTISLTGAKLAGGATCVVSVDVTATTPGSYTNSTGPVTATQPSSLQSAGTGDTETLTVVGDPTISIDAPKGSPRYSFGQNVKAKFSCAEAPGGPGIASCTASVRSGATVNDGGRLPTSAAGPQTLTVLATSNDGAIVTETANYTVRPNNHVVVQAVKTRANGAVTLTVKVPGGGTLRALETAGTTVFGTETLKPIGDGTVKVTVTPTTAGAGLLSAAGPAGVTTKVKLTFTPQGGTPHTVVKRIHLS